MTPFRFPIPPDAVRLFQNRDSRHVFATAAVIRGEVCACDGYAAIRAYRGHWQESDWPEASPEFTARFDKIPFDKIPPHDHQEWVPLDDERATIKDTLHTQWLRVGVAVFPSALVRLLARLPRAEIVPPERFADALYCRFNGGQAILANQGRETATKTIFRPRTDYTGHPISRNRAPAPNFSPPPPPEPPLENWPPVDQTLV